jgi:hypothetical protein
VKPHKPVSKDTIRRWILIVLKLAGIDTSKFKAHSVIHAVSSKANILGIPLTEILSKAGWTGSTTFEKFYNIPICHDSSFAENLLETSNC